MTASPSILYGIHPIREALLAGRRKIHRLYVVNDRSPRIAGITQLARSHAIPVESISAKRLDGMVKSENHQGIGAQTEGYPYADAEHIMATSGRALILVMDGIQDPRNAGALIRTAACVGVTGIFLPKDRSVSITPSVVLASAGAVEHIRLARVTNINRILMQLKSKGIWVAGLDPTAEGSLYEADLNVPLALVVGSEQKGIRPLVRKSCDFLVSIPQKGDIDSLNVSVAGAVALYEAFRQRQSAFDPNNS